MRYPDNARYVRVGEVVRRSRPSGRWAVAGGVLAACAAVAAAVYLLPESRPSTREDPALAALTAAIAEEGAFDSRLAGGYASGRKRRPEGQGATPFTLNATLLAHVAALQRRVQQEPSAPHLHAWGIAQLARGDLDAATASLEEAAALDSSDPVTLNNLAAIYIARAARMNRSDDLPRALAAAGRSLALDRNSIEAMFNRALVLSALNLRLMARDAWQATLDHETDAEWRAEEQRRLAALDAARPGHDWASDRLRLLDASARGNRSELRQLLPDYTQQARALIEDDLLPRWAEQAEAKHEPASSLLAAIEALAQELSQITRDRLTIDAIRLARQGSRSSEAARGLVAYGRARTLYEANRISESAPLFAEADAHLRRAASPLAWWAAHHLAIVDYYAGRHDAAKKRQNEIAAVAASKGYLALAARAHWMIGLTDAFQSNHLSALDEYREALRGFAAIREPEHEASVHSLLGGAYLYLGDHRRSWDHTLKAVMAQDALTAPRRRQTQLIAAATVGARVRLHEAALAFAEEALRSAGPAANPDYQAEANIHLARNRAALGTHAAARDALDAARLAVNQVADPLIRPRLQAEIAVTEAETLATFDPARAVRSAREASAFFASSRSSLRLPRLLLAEARAQRASGARAAAEQALLAGLERFESERAALPPDQATRVSHFDEAWETARELLALRVKAAVPPAEAFALADRARARSLAEKIAPGAPPISPDDLKNALGEHEAVLYLAQLPDTLLAWRIDRHDVTVGSVPLTREAAARLASDVQRGLQRADGNWRGPAGELYRLLIAPLQLAERQIHHLWVIPDQEQTGVPFSALWNRERSRPLVEEVSIGVAPSAVLLTQHFQRRRAVDLTRILAVGAGTFRGFDPLPNAAREAEELTHSFRGVTALIDGAATKPAIVQKIRSASVFHFAGHALPNVEFPDMSRLILRDDSADGALTIREIERLAAPLDLVVLSACQTADGPVRGGDSAFSIARAFASARGPIVVATRWKIHDDAARAWIRGFYQEMARGSAPAHAAALATRSAIRSGISAADWASWAVLF